MEHAAKLFQNIFDRPPRDKEQGWLHELHTYVHGNPMALNLSLRQARRHGWKYLLGYIREEHDDLQDQETALNTVAAKTYVRLSEDRKRQLRYLGALPQWSSAPGAVFEALWSCGPNPTHKTLTELCELGLLSATKSGDMMRYRLHDFTRKYARKELYAVGAAEIRHSHAWPRRYLALEQGKQMKREMKRVLQKPARGTWRWIFGHGGRWFSWQAVWTRDWKLLREHWPNAQAEAWIYGYQLDQRHLKSRYLSAAGFVGLGCWVIVAIVARSQSAGGVNAALSAWLVLAFFTILLYFLVIIIATSSNARTWTRFRQIVATGQLTTWPPDEEE